MADNSVFNGSGIFIFGDPQQVLNMQSKPDWVALRQGETETTQANIQALQNAGIKVFLYASDPNTYKDSASVAKDVGADGVIYETEKPTQLPAAMAASQSDTPQALIYQPNSPQETGLDLSKPGSFPPGFAAMPEAYENYPYPDMQNHTPGALADQAKNAGATTVVPIFGTFQDNYAGYVGMDTYLNQMQGVSSATGYGAFYVGDPYPAASNLRPMSSADLTAYEAWRQAHPDQASLDSFLNHGASGTSTSTTSTNSSTSSTNQSKEKKNPATAKPKKPPVTTLPPTALTSGLNPSSQAAKKASAAKKPPVTTLPPTALTSGLNPGAGNPAANAPPPKPVGNVIFTKTTANGLATLSYDANGNIVEQAAGKNPYVVGTWDPTGSQPEGTTRVGTIPPKPGDSSYVPPKAPANQALASAVSNATAANSGNPPAWRVNPDWTSTDSSLVQKAGLNPSGVLEQRPGDNPDVTIFRLADGTYKAYNSATGAVTDAGSWGPGGQGLAGYTSSTTSQTDPLGGSGGGGNLAAPPATTTTTQDPTQSSTPAPALAPTPGDDGGLGKFETPTTPAVATPDTSTSSSGSSASYNASPTGDITPATNPGGACFPAGTLVLTPKGQVDISLLKAGDKVLTWSLSLKKMVSSKITEFFTHQARDTILLKTTSGSVITTTVHRFYTGKEWTPAGSLIPDKSQIQDKDGKLHKVISITKATNQDVYNFHVNHPDHNYFANNYLVHNMKAEGS